MLAAGNGQLVNLNEVASFWWQHQPLQLDPRITDLGVQQFALNESLSALFGVLRSCSELWVNNIHCDEHADFKPRQLRLARQHGLRVPNLDHQRPSGRSRVP